MKENLTLDYIDKTDYGLYVCQASNEHTTTNITTLIIVASKLDSLDRYTKKSRCLDLVIFESCDEETSSFSELKDI